MIQNKWKIKNKKLFAITMLISVIVIFSVIFMFRVYRDVSGTSRQTDYITITIPQGAGVSQISNILRSERIISHPRIFRFYVGRQNDVLFQQGDHTLNRNMSFTEIIEILGTIPQIRQPEDVVRVTIPEGFEVRHIMDRLYNAGLINRDRFMHEVNNGDFDFDFVRAINLQGRINRLEGYLFPATYDILPTDTEFDIVNMMLQAFNDIVLPVYNEINPSQTLDEIIIMASIIEREAVNDAERPNISGVFNNRIRIGMMLQSCATVKYTFELGERPAILSYAQTRIASPYNTYRYAGLPIGPIAVPGLPSIRAAMQPATHDYIFFTANVDGTGHVFSRTLAEHNAASRERERATRNN